MYGSLPPGDYAAYLRKSRIDLEAEARGEEDTYARHKRILADLSKRLNVPITKVYQEKPATSGERISERPEMIQLLSDVEDQKWSGILVVEVERLARGDTMDQGIVAQAFKYSNTLIVTPMRTYDPTNPDDEEYFEFGLFMSRREFKTTTRRLQGGRTDGVKEGRYVGNIAPYGFTRKKLPGKGFTLEPHPDQAPIVELIFSLYTSPDPKKRMGTARIARYLNEVLRIPTLRNAEWTVATVNGILRNPTYIGNVRWNSRPQVRRKQGKSRPRRSREDTLERPGIHDGIVSEEIFERAQEIMQSNSHPRSFDGRISNPLAAIVRCGKCGGAMVGRPSKKAPMMLMCSRQSCDNVSSYVHVVEEKILAGLREWLRRYSEQWLETRPESHRNDDTKLRVLKASIDGFKKQREKLDTQKSSLHDLLEQNKYTWEVFMERSSAIKKSMDEIDEGLKRAEEELELEKKRISAKTEIIPKVREVLSLYTETDDPAEKNRMLKSVLESVTYQKDVGGRWSGVSDQFKLALYPRTQK